MSYVKKYSKTTVFIIDNSIWNWAQYKAKELGLESVSEYLFRLIKKDREQKLL